MAKTNGIYIKRETLGIMIDLSEKGLYDTAMAFLTTKLLASNCDGADGSTCFIDSDFIDSLKVGDVEAIKTIKTLLESNLTTTSKQVLIIPLSLFIHIHNSVDEENILIIESLVTSLKDFMASGSSIYKVSSMEEEIQVRIERNGLEALLSKYYEGNMEFFKSRVKMILDTYVETNGLRELRTIDIRRDTLLEWLGLIELNEIDEVRNRCITLFNKDEKLDIENEVIMMAFEDTLSAIVACDEVDDMKHIIVTMVNGFDGAPFDEEEEEDDGLSFADNLEDMLDELLEAIDGQDDSDYVQECKRECVESIEDFIMGHSCEVIDEDKKQHGTWFEVRFIKDVLSHEREVPFADFLYIATKAMEFDPSPIDSEEEQIFFNSSEISELQNGDGLNVLSRLLADYEIKGKYLISKSVLTLLYKSSKDGREELIDHIIGDMINTLIINENTTYGEGEMVEMPRGTFDRIVELYELEEDDAIGVIIAELLGLNKKIEVPRQVLNSFIGPISKSNVVEKLHKLIIGEIEYVDYDDTIELSQDELNNLLACTRVDDGGFHSEVSRILNRGKVSEDDSASIF